MTSELMQETALRLALDEREAPSVRCRATEALRHATDEKTLGKLMSLLHGPRLDVRRSAALPADRPGSHEELEPIAA